MIDAGAVESIAAGHFPLEVIAGADNIRATVNGFLAQKNGFESCVRGGLAAFPGTVTIDQLYDHLSAHRDRMTSAFLAVQFPKMPTFFKLTLLNYCRQHLIETRDQAGWPAFTAAS